MNKAQAAQQGATSSSPAQRVRFRHPDTGEEQDGHIHGVPGPLGASVVDGRGQMHKVPHGQYLHHNDAGGAAEGEGGERPSAEKVGQAARKHLELGAEAPLAVYGAIALLTIGGCHAPHAWRVKDVTIKGPDLLAHPDKLKTDEAPLVKLVAQLVKGRKPTDPLFTVDGKPVTEDAVTTYVRRFGSEAGLIGGRTVAPPESVAAPKPARTPMAKASAQAYHLPAVVPPYKTWKVDGYTVMLRKSASGIESMTLEGPGLDLPLHEIVRGDAHAQQIARQVIDRVRRGRAPNRGVFFRIGSA